MDKTATNISTETEKNKFSTSDWGWVAINIGMAIGAGIVFLPIQAGIVGLWVFLIAIGLAYPALYLFQWLFINTVADATHCEDYPSVISGYLGKKWGIFLGFLYFLMMVIWLFVYVQTLTNDSAAYLYSYKITPVLLSQYDLYGLGIIILLAFLAFKSRKLLFKVAEVLSITILIILLLIAFLIIPWWDYPQIKASNSIIYTIKEVIITLPFAMTSILFLQSLCPMVIALRAEGKPVEYTRRKAVKIMNASFLIVGGIVFFFALSCTLAVGHQKAIEAFTKNISFMAILAEYFPGNLVPILGIILTITAIMTSAFGVLLGFHEACMGLSINIFFRNKEREKINLKKLSFAVIIFTVFFAWTSILLNLPILYFTIICSPIFGIIGCFIPAILVYKNENLKKYRGIATYIVIITGILLCLSPFLAFS